MYMYIYCTCRLDVNMCKCFGIASKCKLFQATIILPCIRAIADQTFVQSMSTCKLILVLGVLQ